MIVTTSEENSIQNFFCVIQGWAGAGPSHRLRLRPKSNGTAPQHWSRPSFLVPPPELFFVSRTEQSWFWQSPSTGISLQPDFSLCLEQDTESMMVKAPYFEALKAEMADLYGDQAEMVSQYIF